MKVDKTSQLQNLADELKQAAPKQCREHHPDLANRLKDAFDGSIKRFPTLPVKLPDGWEKASPSETIEKLMDDINKGKHRFPTLPPSTLPHCEEEQPPILWDGLDPKYQEKRDDTRLA